MTQVATLTARRQAPKV